MWGSRRSTTTMHVKTASDSSSATAEDSASSAAPTSHHRRGSSITQYLYYYVQSPTLDSSGSTRLQQSLDMSRNMESLPIWDEERDEWEKIGLEDSVSAAQIAGECRNGQTEPGYYNDFENKSGCPVLTRVMAAFAVVFAASLVVLWGMGRNSNPRIFVQDIVFLNLNIQQGVDNTGVPTKMISLNSTVRILYRKSTTFFGVHFSSSPLLLHHYGLAVASGQMEKLYQSRKMEENTTTVVVQGRGMPLYGGEQLFFPLKNLPKRSNGPNNSAKVKIIGLNLTFTVTASANILGKFINCKFFKSIRCPLTLDAAQIGKPLLLSHSCIYI